GERRQWPAEQRLERSPAAEALERIRPLGDRLEIVKDRQGGQHYTRCACGHVLALAAENWRPYAGLGLAAIEDVTPNSRLNPKVEIRRYGCPGCGRLHSVDVALKGSPHLYDVQLAL